MGARNSLRRPSASYFPRRRHKNYNICAANVKRVANGLLKVCPNYNGLFRKQCDVHDSFIGSWNSAVPAHLTLCVLTLCHLIAIYSFIAHPCRETAGNRWVSTCYIDFATFIQDRYRFCSVCWRNLAGTITTATSFTVANYGIPFNLTSCFDLFCDFLYVIVFTQKV